MRVKTLGTLTHLFMDYSTNYYNTGRLHGPHNVLVSLHNTTIGYKVTIQNNGGYQIPNPYDMTTKGLIV